MGKKRRFFIEMLAPPLFASLWLTILSFYNVCKGTFSASDFLMSLAGFPVLLMFAYLFGIIPAALYAFAMEFWFERGLFVRLGWLCTIGWSGFLGALAGYGSAEIGNFFGILIPSDCFQFLPAGAVIGLLVGFFVSRKQASLLNF
jgi:hypothetical protein